MSLDFTPNPLGGSRGETRRMKRRLQRVDGRSRASRRIKSLEKAYRAAIGEAADAPFMAEKVKTLAELSTLCDALRGAALRGEHIDYLALNRLENSVARLRAEIGLGGPLSAESDSLPLRTLAELLGDK
jgi:hypothetical protein